MHSEEVPSAGAHRSIQSTDKKKENSPSLLKRWILCTTPAHWVCFDIDFLKFVFCTIRCSIECTCGATGLFWIRCWDADDPAILECQKVTLALWLQHVFLAV